MFKMFFIVVLAAMTFSVSAEDYRVTVCSLQSHSVGNTAYLKPCDTWVSKNACSSGSYVAWKMNEFQGQSMYSAALSALVSGLDVYVRMSNGQCLGTYDEITMIRIVK